MLEMERRSGEVLPLRDDGRMIMHEESVKYLFFE
jgi:hypothetical protein